MGIKNILSGVGDKEENWNPDYLNSLFGDKQLLSLTAIKKDSWRPDNNARLYLVADTSKSVLYFGICFPKENPNNLIPLAEITYKIQKA